MSVLGLRVVGVIDHLGESDYPRRDHRIDYVAVGEVYALDSALVDCACTYADGEKAEKSGGGGCELHRGKGVGVDVWLRWNGSGWWKTETLLRGIITRM